MKKNSMDSIHPEIIIPINQGILRIPMDSPLVKIIDKNASEETDFEWQQLVNSDKVILFLRTSISLKRITQELLSHGKNAMTTISVSGYDENNHKKIVTGKLINIVHLVESMNFIFLETIIIGNLQVLTENRYFKRKPLWGKKIVSTRATLQSYEVVHDLESLGADVLEFPLTNLKASVDYDQITKALEQIQTYQWIIFDMNFRVDYFIAYLLGSGYNLNRLKNIKICALTLEAIERLNEFGLEVHYFSPDFRANIGCIINGIKKKWIKSRTTCLNYNKRKKRQNVIRKTDGFASESVGYSYFKSTKYGN